MSTAFRVTFSDALSAAIQRVTSDVDPRVQDMLEAIGEKGVDIAQGLSPVRTGRYKDSIDYELEARAVTVGAGSRRAHLVEMGRRPGRMAPPSLIEEVMGVPPNEAFLIARAIGQVGTPDTPVFELTRQVMEIEVAKIAGQLGREISLAGS